MNAKKILTLVLFFLVVLIPAFFVFGIFFFGPELSHILVGL